MGVGNMRKLKKDKYIGGGAKRQGFKIFNAFTLAEMMVVMLIVSIVLAAMAPVMTTKNKVDNSSPWRYSPANSSDAYFGAGEAMRAFIGQVNGEDADLGKLIVNNNATDNSHILFKSNNDILGDLYFNGTSLILGERRSRSTGAIGDENINIGHENWPTTDITGSSNITIGDASMRSLTTGSHNIGLGTTLTSVTTGEHNIGIGDDSLTNITGNGNIAIGGNANVAVTTASKTIAIGTNSVASSFGAIAIGSNLTTSEAHGPEQDAAQARVSNSIAIGNNTTSGANNGAGQNSIAIGYQAKANSTSDSGTSGIAIGAYSNAGGHSVALGISALKDNTTGSDNIAVGTSALKSNTTGSDNIAVGENSLYANTTGGHNISIGYAAMQHNDTGSNNIAIGREAMYFQTNINTGNTAVGTQAMAGTSKASNYYNTAIGYQALHSAGNTSHNAGHNTAVGAEALYNNITGDYNTSIGSGACRYVTGSNKTCIGAFSGPSSSNPVRLDSKERIFIGSGDPATLEIHNGLSRNSIIGSTRGSSNAVLINGDLIVNGFITSKFYDTDSFVTPGRYGRYMHWYDINSGYVSAWRSSDRRLKYVGKENTSGLEKIKQLKVFNYTFKKDATKTPHVGVIAQDLQKVFPNAVKKGADGFLTIRMEDMFYAVINAIKELDAKVSALQKENQELRQLVKQVQEDNKRLDERLKKLEAKK